MRVNRLDLPWLWIYSTLMLTLCLFLNDGSDILASMTGPLLLISCPVLVILVLGRYLPATGMKPIFGLVSIILIIFMFTPLLQAPDSGIRFATLATLFTFFAAMSMKATPEQAQIKEPS